MFNHSRSSIDRTSVADFKVRCQHCIDPLLRAHDIGQEYMSSSWLNGQKGESKSSCKLTADA